MAAAARQSSEESLFIFIIISISTRHGVRALRAIRAIRVWVGVTSKVQLAGAHHLYRAVTVMVMVVPGSLVEGEGMSWWETPCSITRT